MSTACSAVSSTGLVGDPVVHAPVSVLRNSPNLNALPPAMLPNLDEGNSASSLNSNQYEMPFVPGGVVQFPAEICQVCPLRERCTTSRHGRSVSIHPDEALLRELRQRQLTPVGRAKLRQRVAVEHALAHIGYWQGRRARYRGRTACPLPRSAQKSL